jgi:hypothetical protein
VLFCFVFSTALGPLGLPLLPSVVSALFAQLAFQAVLLWWMSKAVLLWWMSKQVAEKASNLKSDGRSRKEGRCSVLS